MATNRTGKPKVFIKTEMLDQCLMLKPSLVLGLFRFHLTMLGWYFDRVCRLSDFRGGKQED